MRAQLDLLGLHLMRTRGHHSAIASATMQIARIVNGGNLSDVYAGAELEHLVRRLAPASTSDLRRCWASALRRAVGSAPIATNDSAIVHMDPTQRRALIAAWWATGPCADPKLIANGAAGADALAIVNTLTTIGLEHGSTTFISSAVKIGELLCIGDTSVQRREVLWRRWVDVTQRGFIDFSTHQKHGTRYRLRHELTHPTRGIDPGTMRVIATASTPSPPIDTFALHIDLNSDLHSPRFGQWVRRQGGRQEWLLWTHLFTGGPKTVSELVAATRLGRVQVMKYLRLMLQAHEVERDGSFYGAVSTPSEYAVDPMARPGCRACAPARQWSS